MGSRVSRRGFLRTAAGAAVGAVGFPYVVSSSALGKAGSIAASNRITLGFIAVGGRGSGLLTNFIHLSDSQVVAVVSSVKLKAKNVKLWNSKESS